MVARAGNGKFTKETLSPQKAFPNAKDRIVKAFVIDGRQYYEFYDFNNVPSARAMWGFVYFNEMSMRCTREYLIAHCKAFHDAMTVGDGKRIDLTRLSTLNTQLEERLNFIFEPNIAYKLATVVFFDETENPYEYDQKYNQEKADLFRKAPIQDFFLSRPIGKLIPYMEKFSADLPTYFEVMQKMNRVHLESIFTTLSEEHTNSEWYKSLLSQKQEVLASLKSNNSASTIIIS